MLNLIDLGLLVGVESSFRQSRRRSSFRVLVREVGFGADSRASGCVPSLMTFHRFELLLQMAFSRPLLFGCHCSDGATG